MTFAVKAHAKSTCTKNFPVNVKWSHAENLMEHLAYVEMINSAAATNIREESEFYE